MKRNSWLAGLLCATVMVALGCGSGSSSSGTASASGNGAGKKLRIAVIPKGSTHEYWKSLHEGANQAAAEEGNVEIIWKGPLKEDDREAQVKVVEDFITNGVDGIVLAPLDNTALRAPVNEATKSGIPVVIVDSALDSDAPVSFVATDNEKGGQMAAKRMAELLGDKGKIVLLRYEEGSASTMAREKGFLDEIQKHPGIQVVSSNQYGGATVDTAQRASETLLAPLRNGDKLTIQGVYTPNESTTFGMLRALQDSGMAGKVHFVGFDVSPKLLEAVRNGQIEGLIVQNPRKMGYLGVKAVVDKINGKTPEKKVDTGATLITKENMDTEENKKLLAPPKA